MTPPDTRAEMIAKGLCEHGVDLWCYCRTCCDGLPQHRILSSQETPDDA